MSDWRDKSPSELKQWECDEFINDELVFISKHQDAYRIALQEYDNAEFWYAFVHKEFYVICVGVEIVEGLIGRITIPNSMVLCRKTLERTDI